MLAAAVMVGLFMIPSVTAKAEDKKADESQETKVEFADVRDSGDWFYNTVYKIVEAKNENGTSLMSGYANGSNKFGPVDPLTRQDFAVILYRLANEPKVGPTKDTFPDADPDAYYYKSIVWAKTMGVIKGYDDGAFGVGDNITREQVATILYRYAADFLDIDTAAAKKDLTLFIDRKKVSDFATEGMEWAVGTGIIKGKDLGIRLDPQGKATRAEIAEMILRFLFYLDETVYGHTDGYLVIENEKEATCTASGKYDEVIRCGRCQGDFGRVTKTTPALGHEIKDGVCTRCGKKIYGTGSGTGDKEIEDIKVEEGLYKVHFTNAGESNCIIWVYDADEGRDLAVNAIGDYDGYYYLSGKAPYKFDIKSDGDWSYTIEALGLTSDTSFAGTGDDVTDLFVSKSKIWHVTHDGKNNFSVWLYTKNGEKRTLVINETGDYDGPVVLDIPTDSNAFFEIRADGNWTIEPAVDLNLDEE